jgi:hypothetical protein
MGFLKKFFRNVFHESAGTVNSTSSFELLSEEELETHLAVSKYGNFQLTDAVRPSYDLKVRPEQGYRFDTYVDDETGGNVPVLMGAASREKLFELFMDLLDPLGDEVDVVLETSHSQNAEGHVDLYREHIDLPVLKSMLWDYEDLLLNDGCTGIAVLNPNIPQEIQLDEHKLLIVYGKPLAAYEEILAEHGFNHKEEMKFITEAEHVHASNEVYHGQFEELKTRLGMDCGYQSMV